MRNVAERVNRTLRDKLHRHFTYKNTYKYIDVLPKFVKGYNATVHSTTGMAPSEVSDTDVLTIWNKMRGKAGKTQCLSKLKFRVGQHVRISKEKMKFAKGGEQNYITQVFKVRKVVHRTQSRVRTRGLARPRDRRPVLQRRIGSRSHHETDHL